MIRGILFTPFRLMASQVSHPNTGQAVGRRENSAADGGLLTYTSPSSGRGVPRSGGANRSGGPSHGGPSRGGPNPSHGGSWSA